MSRQPRHLLGRARRRSSAGQVVRARREGTVAGDPASGQAGRRWGLRGLQGCKLLKGEPGRKGAHLLHISRARSERGPFQVPPHPPTGPHTAEPASSAAGRRAPQESSVRAAPTEGRSGSPAWWGGGGGPLPTTGTCRLLWPCNSSLLETLSSRPWVLPLAHNRGRKVAFFPV